MQRTFFLRDWHLLPLVAACGLAAVGCADSDEPLPVSLSLPTVVRGHLADDAAASAVWPGWRGGPAGGVSAARGLPVSWSASDGFDWKVAVPGEGNSSPVVWDDRIVLTTALGEGPTRTLALVCFDAESGELLWQSEAATAAGATHAKNGYASATPATNGERIFVSFGSAGLFCYDFGGELLWRVALGDLKHMWGTASSPVLFGDLVIQLCDHQHGSYLAAFHQASGERIWEARRDSYGSWSTPVLIEARDEQGQRRVELVVNGTGTNDARGGFVIAYDPATGAELWRVQGTTDIVCPTLIVGDDLLVSTSGRNGPIFAIEPGGGGNVTASRVRWKLRRGGAYVPTGLAYEGRLYTLADGGVVSCHELKSGKRIWQQRLRGTFTASLVAGDGKIYAVSESGTVYVLAAGDTFQLLAENPMNERCLATPALAGGAVVLRTARHLYRIPPTPAVETVRGDDDQQRKLSRHAEQSADEDPTAHQSAGAESQLVAEQAVDAATYRGVHAEPVATD